MMHCTMEDLGALRAGEGSVWARRHIITCAICQAELEALYQRVAQLKALPTLRPPRDRWPAVRAVMNSERARRRRSRSAWGGALAAAALPAGGLLGQPRSLGPSGNLHAELTPATQQSGT